VTTANCFCYWVKYFPDTPRATVRCLPIEPGNEGLLFGTSVGAHFDAISLHEIECGITLTNIRDISAEKLPRTLESLTSQPNILTEEDIDRATKALQQIENEPGQEVIKSFY